MSPEQGWRLADEWYRDRLKFDWERKTLQEAQALFSRLGLTSSFWSLQ